MAGGAKSLARCFLARIASGGGSVVVRGPNAKNDYTQTKKYEPQNYTKNSPALVPAAAATVEHERLALAAAARE